MSAQYFVTHSDGTGGFSSEKACVTKPGAHHWPVTHDRLLAGWLCGWVAGRPSTSLQGCCSDVCSSAKQCPTLLRLSLLGSSWPELWADMENKISM